MTAATLERIDTARAPSAVGVFVALLARDLRVLRRDLGGFVVRLIMQPLLFVFVFAYVLPEIGAFGANGATTTLTYSTILVPGLIAVSINFQGVQAVALPWSATSPTRRRSRTGCSPRCRSG